MSTDPVSQPNSDLHSVLEEIERRLRAAKRRCVDEIRHYPPPIPACDAQFNYLIERRNIVNQELGQVRALARATEPPAILRTRVLAFLEHATCLDDQTRRAMRLRAGASA